MREVEHVWCQATVTVKLALHTHKLGEQVERQRWLDPRADLVHLGGDHV